MSRDDSAYLAFVEQRSSQLRRLGYLMCGDWQRAEDHTQEALIRVYMKWHRIEPRGAYAYARQCLTRVVIDESRRKRSGEFVMELEDRPDTRSSDSTEASLDLRRALRQLPTQRRICIVLRFFHDLSVEDTARAMGTSQGTVKSQTSRALTQLRTLLSPEFQPAGPAGEGGFHAVQG